MTKKKETELLDPELAAADPDATSPVEASNVETAEPGTAEPKYRALVLLWSYQHNRYVQPGEIVWFDLSDAVEYKPAIEILLEIKAIEPYTGVWPLPAPEETKEEEV